jgi:hypothetical protein
VVLWGKQCCKVCSIFWGVFGISAFIHSLEKDRKHGLIFAAYNVIFVYYYFIEASSIKISFAQKNSTDSIFRYVAVSVHIFYHITNLAQTSNYTNYTLSYTQTTTDNSNLEIAINTAIKRLNIK